MATMVQNKHTQKTTPRHRDWACHGDDVIVGEIGDPAKVGYPNCAECGKPIEARKVEEEGEGVVEE